MSEPRRLVAEGTEFERGVLRSARLDAPNDEGLKRTLLAIGAAAATLSTTSATAGAGVVAGGVAAGGGPSALAGAGASMLAKWVCIAVVVACAGTAVTDASLAPRHSTPPHLAAASAPAATLLLPAPSPLARVPGVLDLPATDHERPPGLEQTSAEAPSRVKGAANGHKGFANQERSAPAESAPALPLKPRAPSSLQEQVAVLDRVRALLAERNPARALEELDGYDHAFPSSDLGEEATVLRIDALVDDGDAPGAMALARRLLLKNPASPHAAHLRQVLGAHNL